MSEPLTGNAVQQLGRPAMATPTKFPDELVELAESKGMRLSWQPNKGEIESLLAAQGIEPFMVDVHLKAWDPELHKQFKAGKSLRTIRSLVKSDGKIRNMDTIACVQPQAAWEEFEEVSHRMEALRTARADEDDDIERLKEQLRKLGVATQFPDQKGGPIKDAVYVGKDPSASTRGRT